MMNEMTAEEAIRWLDAIKKYYIHGGDEAYDKKRMKAIDKAIQALESQRNLTNEELYQSFIKLEAENERLHDALESQPTDAVRLISLDDIMAHFPKANFNGDPIENKKAYPYWKTDITGLISILKSVPMVNPCVDCISREEALLALTGMDLPTDRDKLIALFTERIQQMPSVTPERPKGKWNISVYETLDGQGLFECSNCGETDFYYDKKYCPNCGAEMSGGGDDGREQE